MFIFQSNNPQQQQQRQEQPIRAQFTGPPAYGATNPTYSPPSVLLPIGSANQAPQPPAYNVRPPPPQYDPPPLSPSLPPRNRSISDASFTNIYSRNFAKEASFIGGQSLEASSNDFYANQSQGSRTQLLPAYEPNPQPTPGPTPRGPPPQYSGTSAAVRDDDLTF